MTYIFRNVKMIQLHGFESTYKHVLVLNLIWHVELHLYFGYKSWAKPQYQQERNRIWKELVQNLC